MIEIKRNNIVSCYYINNKEVQNIIIFENGQKLFETKMSWFELSKANYNDRITSFNVTDLKRKNKVDLKEKNNFYVNSINEYGEKGCTLYLLNGKDIKINNVYEELFHDSKEEKSWLLVADINFLQGALIRDENITNAIVRKRYIVRRELKQAGIEKQRIITVLKKHKIEYNYNIEKLINEFNLSQYIK